MQFVLGQSRIAFWHLRFALTAEVLHEWAFVRFAGNDGGRSFFAAFDEVRDGGDFEAAFMFLSGMAFVASFGKERLELAGEANFGGFAGVQLADFDFCYGMFLLILGDGGERSGEAK